MMTRWGTTAFAALVASPAPSECPDHKPFGSRSARRAAGEGGQPASESGQLHELTRRGLLARRQRRQTHRLVRLCEALEVRAVVASAGKQHARRRVGRFARKGLYNSRIDQHPFCHWVCRQPCASHDLHRAALRLPCRQLDRHAAPRPGCTVGVTTALPEGPSGLRLGRGAVSALV